MLISNKKELITKAAVILAAIFCLFKMVTGITTGTEMIYETTRSMYLWKGIFYFSISILILEKVNYKNKWLWFFSLIYVVGVLSFFTLKGYRENSPTLWKWYTRQYLSLGVILLVMLDAFFEKKIYKWQELNKILSILLIITSIGICISRKFEGNCVVIFAIIILLSFIKFEQERLNKGVIIFLISYYLAFIKMFTESLIKVPYDGSIRYYGTFTNNGLFGTFTGGAVICAMALGIVAYRSERLSLIRSIALTVILAIYPLLATSLISARVAMLGIVMTVLMLVFCLPEQKAKRLKNLRIIGFTILIAIVLLLIIIRICENISWDEAWRVFYNYPLLNSKFMFWYERFKRFTSSDSFTGVLKGGTIINGIDGFTSERISYAVLYLKSINLWGHTSLAIWAEEYFEKYISHPHNTYIAFIYLYGIICGLLIIVNLFVNFFRMLKASILINSKTKFFELGACIWMMYAFAVYLNEDYLTNYLVTFVSLIFVALVVNKDKSRKNKNEKIVVDTSL